MSSFQTLLDLFLHLDVHLNDIIQNYGSLTYAILFAIIFCETGLVIMPFLPGDSLLFAAGSLAALGSLDAWKLFGLLSCAAILGDSMNYWIGRKVGDKGFSEHGRFLNKRYLDQTHAFFEKHGGKAVVLARFAPLIRTFAPFVAGLGHMPYARFLAFSVGGTFLWTGSCIGAGFAFGNIPVVKQNFSLVVLGIVGISLLPAVIGAIRSRRST
jgi:membrane-associated protein